MIAGAIHFSGEVYSAATLGTGDGQCLEIGRNNYASTYFLSDCSMPALIKAHRGPLETVAYRLSVELLDGSKRPPRTASSLVRRIARTTEQCRIHMVSRRHPVKIKLDAD